ncbi:hypothetical protein [Antarcticimicrobium sediminis]|nr:hypothetical protein [Antarcticimicrobium sediminis]
MELGEADGRVTRLHPGMVNTPFFAQGKPGRVLLPHLPVYPKPEQP